MSRLLTLAGGNVIALDNIDVNLPSNLIDMFSRLRVSEPTTQIVINQSSAIRNRLVTEGEVSGSNTSSNFNPAQAATTLTVGATTGLRRLKSYVAGLYQPGKSLLFFFTFNLGAAANGVTKRVGYFDPNDGVFLEQTSTELSWVLRSSTGGSVSEAKRITQSNWNTDKFDGSQTGYNFDSTKCHIGFIALEWLGVGDVAVGFIYNRVPVVAHIFSHPNIESVVYMRTANLYPCYEIERTAAGVGTASMQAVCASLLTEGREDSLGVTYSVSRGISSTFSAAIAEDYFALMLFRLNPAFPSARVKITEIEVNVITSCNYNLYLVKNPTFNPGYTPTWVNRQDSAIQYDITITNIPRVTNALENETLTTASSRANNFSAGGSATSTLDYMGTDFNYTPEVWALVIQCDSNNVNIKSAIAKFWEQL